MELTDELPRNPRQLDFRLFSIIFFIIFPLSCKWADYIRKKNEKKGQK